MNLTEFSPEFSLLLELTHPQASGRTQFIKAALNRTGFNPTTFLRMLRWHRMIPQAWQGLSPLRGDVPADLLARLKRMNDAHQKQYLLQSAWAVRIIRALNAEGVDFVMLKGMALSQQLYGNGGSRQTHDIDIMIEKEERERAETILTGFGFTRILPHADASPKQMRFLNRHRKDREYLHPTDRVMVDLHWHLFDEAHPYNASLSELKPQTVPVSLHGMTVPALGGSRLWLYQCLHGSACGWYRLRWLNDIAMLLGRHPPEWDALLAEAERYHCTPSLLEAVGLACLLYRQHLPEPLQPLLAGNRPVWREIKRSADRLINMRYIPSITYVRRIAFWAPPAALFRALFTHVPIAIEDFNRFPLPDRLFFLYYLLRPFSFLSRRLMPTVGKSRSG